MSRTMSASIDLSDVPLGQVIDVRIRKDAVWRGRPLLIKGATVRMAYQGIQTQVEESTVFTIADDRGAMRKPTSRMVIGQAIYENVPPHIHVPDLEDQRPSMGYAIQDTLIDSVVIVR